MPETDRTPIGEFVKIYRRGKRNIWTADFLENGRHRRQSLKTTDKKIAIRRALVLESKIASGTYRPAAPATTIEAARSQYIEYLRGEGRAPKTIVRYQGELNALQMFCDQRGVRRLSQVSPAIVDAYRGERRKTHHPKTIHHETMVVKQLLRWPETRHLIAGEPFAALPGFEADLPAEARAQLAAGPGDSCVGDARTARRIWLPRFHRDARGGAPAFARRRREPHVRLDSNRFATRSGDEDQAVSQDPNSSRADRSVETVWTSQKPIVLFSSIQPEVRRGRSSDQREARK